MTLTPLVTGCGGGGGNSEGIPTPPVTATLHVQGIAATGRAMSRASVTARCSDGKTFTGVADADGRFDVELVGATSSAFPCMLRAALSSPAATFYSYARQGEAVNINPLTDLTLAKALEGSPAAAFEAWGSGSVPLSEAELRDAPQFVLSAMDEASGYRSLPYSDLITPDPFVQAFALGDDRDQLFDAFGAALVQSNLTVSEYQALVIANADRRESFGDTMFSAAVAQRVRPVVEGFDCAPLPAVGSGRHVHCVAKGKKLSRPAKVPDHSTSDLAVVISRASQRQTKTDTAKPFQPAWCTILGNSSSATYKSTDSADTQGPDPLGVYAEEIDFDCPNSVDTAEEITAELVLRDSTISGDPSMGVVVRSWRGTPTVPLGKATIDLLACTSKTIPGLEFVHSTWVDLRFSGTATVGANQWLQVYFAGSQLTAQQVSDLALTNLPQATVRSVLIPISCNGLSTCQGFGPFTQSAFQPSPDLFPPNDVLPVKAVYSDPYAAQTVWVYAIVSDLSNPTQAPTYAAASVACPAHGRPR